jgi:hypothetical protein
MSAMRGGNRTGVLSVKKEYIGREDLKCRNSHWNHAIMEDACMIQLLFLVEFFMGDREQVGLIGPQSRACEDHVG